VLPPTRWLQSSAVSEAGNAYLLHGNQAGAMLPGDVVFTSLDRDGRRRFEVNLTAEDPGVEYGTNALVDERHHRVFVVTRTYSPTEPLPHVLVLSARDTLTGALLWKRDLRALNIPALYPASNGALVLSVMKLVSIGDGDVLAELSEGESIHQQHLVAFAGATGVERWRVQRAGHGALAVSGAGELWLGWAACWSFDYRLSRFDAAGQQVVERQLPMNPLAMSDTAALVPFDGGLGLLEGDLSTVRALPLPRNHRPSTYSGIAWSGDEVTTVTDGPTPALVRVDVDAGAVLWATPTDPAATWRTLRLVADGGTAVTLTFRDGGTGLALYRNDGALSEQCDLGAFATSELAAQRLFGTGGGAFIAYDLPGVFAAPSGWTGSGGRLGTQRP
jgi:outer membrane protein assembly factor BamB